MIFPNPENVKTPWLAYMNGIPARLDYPETSMCEAVEAIGEKYPQVAADIIGRGLVAEPGMVTGFTDVKKLETFMNELMEVFNRYPIRELTVHPRVRKEFYNGSVHMEWFDYAVENSKNPLCYNGDILTLAQAEALQRKYPQVQSMMIGRGLVADPGMLSGGTDVNTLEAFMNELMAVYEVEFGGSRNAIFRLKENWHCMILLFEGSEKLWKKLRKTTDIAEYRAISAEIFATLPMHDELHADW